MKIIIFEEHEIFFFNLQAMQCTILLYEKIFDCEPCMPTGFEHKHQFEPIRHYFFLLLWNPLVYSLPNKN